MTKQISGFFAGLVFGVGLIISGMTNPLKVKAFLNISDQWDPSLLFVIGAAIASYSILHRVIIKRGTPVLASQFYLPTRKDIDANLVVGASLFGVGWGMGGLCPGPALASLLSLSPCIAVFTASMLAGMFLQSLGSTKASSLLPSK